MHVEYLDLACCGVEAASRAAQDAVAALPAAVTDADLNVLVVAGTVTRAAAPRVAAAIEALPEPRRVVAFGVCTISGGPYWDSYAVQPGILADVIVPGCPPRPEALAEALAQVCR